MESKTTTKIKKPKKFDLADPFLTFLKEGWTDIHGAYYHCFSVATKQSLQDTLEYVKEVWSGNNEFYGKEGKECWFYDFHKSIRQTDFFQEAYTKSEDVLLTKMEVKEYNFLWNKVNTDGYDKEVGKSKDRLFNDEYLRFLELRRKKMDEKRDRPITGHLDMILWHLIHVDTEGVLYKTMVDVFEL